MASPGALALKIGLLEITPALIAYFEAKGAADGAREEGLLELEEALRPAQTEQEVRDAVSRLLRQSLAEHGAAKDDAHAALAEGGGAPVQTELPLGDGNNPDDPVESTP